MNDSRSRVMTVQTYESFLYRVHTLLLRSVKYREGDRQGKERRIL